MLLRCDLPGVLLRRTPSPALISSRFHLVRYLARLLFFHEEIDQRRLIRTACPVSAERTLTETPNWNVSHMWESDRRSGRPIPGVDFSDDNDQGRYNTNEKDQVDQKYLFSLHRPECRAPGYTQERQRLKLEPTENSVEWHLTQAGGKKVMRHFQAGCDWEVLLLVKNRTAIGKVLVVLK